MAGPYLWLRDKWGPVVAGSIGSDCRLALESLGSKELGCGWAGPLLYWQGFRVRTEQGMGCV